MEEKVYDWWYSPDKTIPFDIISYGDINVSDGPDLENVILSINGIQYEGSVELDYLSNYWFQHGHFQNHRYQNVLLHLTMINDTILNHGNIPKFSYSIQSNQFKLNQQTDSFWKRKYSFIKNLEASYSKLEIFGILFARALGFFHNRDAMTYIACLNHRLRNIDIDEKSRFLLSQISEYKKSVRPNNQLSKRVIQYLHIENTGFLVSCRTLVKQRYPLTHLIKKLQKANKLYLVKHHLGRDRILQWLYNGIIPFEMYYRDSKEEAYRYYLESLLDELKQFEVIKKFHK